LFSLNGEVVEVVEVVEAVELLALVWAWPSSVPAAYLGDVRLCSR
jgi:hypothetical protein